METKEEHEKAVDKLNIIEQELIILISDANDKALIEKFTEWQDQRSICNNGFMSILNYYVSRIKADLKMPKERVEHHNERVFTENEISQLQTRVHKITGDGEVMKEFNKLLGVNNS